MRPPAQLQSINLSMALKDYTGEYPHTYWLMIEKDATRGSVKRLTLPMLEGGTLMTGGLGDGSWPFRESAPPVETTSSMV